IETIEGAPAVQKEKEYVFKLGVPLISEFKPVEFIGQSRVERVKFEHMSNGSILEIAADTVILAVGQTMQPGAATWRDSGDIFSGGDM
ncbi:dihydropyrimidine dehydrogenase, partial [Alkalihalophilus lindianensis]|nr:dihydropyrimidine dehydrogenase [Alkalihalophilus lindianensis]